jgi:hypothetical protein
LYQIEREIREAFPKLLETEIVKIRMKKATPIMRGLKTWYFNIKAALDKAYIPPLYFNILYVYGK